LKKLALLALTAAMLTVSAFAATYGDSVTNFYYDSNYSSDTKLYPGDILESTNSDNGGSSCICSTVKYLDFDNDEIENVQKTESGWTITILKYDGSNPSAFDHWEIVQNISGSNKTQRTLILKAVMTDDDFTPPVAIALPMVQLSHHSVTGYVGGTLDLDYTYFNMTEPTAAWTSSDETVATVDADGIVTLIKKGEVTITLTVEGYGELKCNIIVKGKGITKR